MTEIVAQNQDITADPKVIIDDYRLVYHSRQVSQVSRREVMSGKAKFGIFGDGKELPQIAMAKVFEKGDFRSGYYRDQTFMFAIGELTTTEFFAQLYAHGDLEADPATAGRVAGRSIPGPGGGSVPRGQCRLRGRSLGDSRRRLPAAREAGIR